MAQYDPQRSRSRPRKADDEGPAPVDALLGDAPGVPVGSPVADDAPAQKAVADKSVAKKAPAKKSIAKKAPAKVPLAENAPPAVEVAASRVTENETPVAATVQPSVAEPGPGWNEPRPTLTSPARSPLRFSIAAIVVAVLALTGLVWWRRLFRRDEGRAN